MRNCAIKFTLAARQSEPDAVRSRHGIMSPVTQRWGFAAVIFALAV
jgi:hypothetical protein